MPFLPVVERELRVASQRSSTFHLRGFAASLALGIVLFVFLFTELQKFSAKNVGINLLVIIASFAFVYCLLAGAFYTSDSLSVEKRNGTLGLLFLTPLRSLDITAGKLAAQSLASFYGLVATIPILALSLLFGGVTSQQFIRTSAVLFACLYLSLCVGLLASALSTDGRRSMGLAVLAIFVISFGPPLMMEILTDPTSRYLMNHFFSLLSPFYLLQSAWSGIDSALFWPSLCLQLGLGTICFLLANVLTRHWFHPLTWTEPRPRRWLRSKIKKIQTTLNYCPYSLSPLFRPQKRKFRDNAQTMTRPFDIIAKHITHHSLIFWTLISLAGASVFGLLWQSNVRHLALGVYSLYPFHLLVKTLVTADACRLLHEDRKQGALELLSVWPQPIHQLPTAYAHQLKKLYTVPLWLISGLNLLALYSFYLDSLTRRVQDADAMVLMSVMFLGGILFLHIDTQALIWTGLKEGLRRSKLNRAIVMTVATVMGPSWIGVVILATIVSGGIEPKEFIGFLVFWQSITVCYVLTIQGRSQRQLWRQSREWLAPHSKP